MAKRTTTKDKAAKEKVNNLLEGILPSKKEDVLEKAVETKGNDWLQDEVTKLTAENEQLKNDVKKALGTLNEKQSGPDAPVDVEEIKRHVRALFKDVEDNYLGKNSTRTRYLQADNKILLDKMLGHFPFLMKR